MAQGELPRSGDDTYTTLNNVLHFGYDPGCGRCGLPADVVDAVSEQQQSGDEESLRSRAVDAFREAVAAELREVDADRTHVVPLSAGLDSRAILATVLDHPDVRPDDVHTITFGSPGTWDFEIGQQVASAADVSNAAIDVSADAFDWSVRSLRDYASNRENPGGSFDGYVNSRVRATAPEDAVIWSGFMGDPTAGGHQPTDPRDEWEDACAYFVDHERYATGMTSPGFDPRASLPDEPYVPGDRLSFEEQLDFALRQQCRIAPTVLGGGTYRTPFAHPAWLRFSLTLPPRHRRERSLFVESFRRAFPDLFSLPTDANAGYPISVGATRRKLRRARLRATQRIASLLDADFTHPDTNYLDFEAAFRSGQLRSTVDELVADFADRGVADWLDPRAIWREHLTGADRTRELQVICDAELYVSESRP